MSSLKSISFFSEKTTWYDYLDTPLYLNPDHIGYRDFINASGVFAESYNKESNDLFALVNFQLPQIKWLICTWLL